MTVTIIVVLELILCAGWISQSNAQLSAFLFPYEHQSVCRGRSISYDCIGNGASMVFISPPLVNDSSPLAQLATDPVLTFNVQGPAATAVKFVDSNSSILLTFTLFISDEQSEGQRYVSCRVTAPDGMVVTNSTTFSVIGALDPEAVDNIQVSVTEPLSYSDDIAQLVPVNISWDSLVIAQEFILKISNVTNGSDIVSAVQTHENRVTVWLQYGTYSAKLCAKDVCSGNMVCQNSTTKVPVERRRQQEPDIGVDPALLAAAIIAGVLGVLLILALTGVVITVIWYKVKE